MISTVIPTSGTLGPDGVPLIAGALRAAERSGDVVVVVTDGRISAEALGAVERAQARVVDVPGPFNFSTAINAGVAAARGQAIVLLNDDVALRRGREPDDWLARLATKRADVVGVRLLDVSERRLEHEGVWFVAAGGMPCHINQGVPVTMAHARDVYLMAVTGAAMLVRRSSFDRLDGFDDGFPLNYGDVDYCLRVRRLGCRVMQANTITLVHRESSTRGKRSMPTSDDYHRLADRHAAFLRGHGIAIDAFAATRLLAAS